MPNIVTVAGLQKAAEKYDPILRQLPAWALAEAIKALRLNVQKVDMKDVIHMERRKSGGTMPYVPTASPITYKDDMLAYESAALEVYETVFKAKENITNYKDVDVQFLGGKPFDNKTKKHPLEYKIIQTMIKTHSEDVMFALFHAERNTAGNNALSCFYGYNSQIDSLLSDGKLTAARGNYAPTGAFSAPKNDSDTAAYENLVDFIGGAHNMLRSDIGGSPLLYVTEAVMINVRAAYRNKVKAFQMPSMEDVKNQIRQDALCPGLEFITHVALGSGHRVMLIKPGLLDFGWNTDAASSFVQVRDPFEDPNIVQFWLQASYGTRLRDWHEKLFRVNDQTNVCLNLAGDYAATGAVKVNIEGPDDARWYISGQSSLRSSGQYILGLAPGNYVIKFKDVDGYSAPADINITVTAGADVVKSASYTTAPAEVAATGISLNKSTTSIVKNATETLTATLTPSGATSTVTWTSDDESVATVAAGVVTAKAAGTCNIIATANGHSATCAVTVTE